MPQTPPTDPRYNSLLAWFGAKDTVVVAFSAGVDSTLVLYAARGALPRNRVVAVIADSPSLARRELEEARRLAKQFDVRLVEIQTTEFEDESYLRNAPDRCYHCKKTLYETVSKSLRATLSEQTLFDQLEGFSAAASTIVDGLNLDDLGDERPGRQAAEEWGVRHPLVEVGLRKSDIREISASFGLPTATKQEMACLSSRIPTGIVVSKEKLSAVEAVETTLETLRFQRYRVRYHELSGSNADLPLQLCRIEFGPEEIRRALEPEMQQTIIDSAKQVGFSFVTVDLEGYRKGGRPA